MPKKNKAIKQKILLLILFLILSLFIVNVVFEEKESFLEKQYVGKAADLKQTLPVPVNFMPCKYDEDCYPYNGGRCKDEGYHSKVCVWKHPDREAGEFSDRRRFEYDELFACEGKIRYREYNDDGSPKWACCLKDLESVVSELWNQENSGERVRRIIRRNKGREYELSKEMCCELDGRPKSKQDGKYNAFCPQSCQPYNTETQFCCEVLDDDEDDDDKDDDDGDIKTYEVKDLREELRDIPRDHIKCCPKSHEAYFDAEIRGDESGRGEVCCDGSSVQTLPEGSNGCCNNQLMQEGEVCCKSKQKGSWRVKEEIMSEEGGSPGCCQIVENYDYFRDINNPHSRYYQYYYFYEVPLKEGEECIYINDFPIGESVLWDYILPYQIESIEADIRGVERPEPHPIIPVSSIPLCNAGIAGFVSFTLEVRDPAGLDSVASSATVGLTDKIPIISHGLAFASKLAKIPTSPINPDFMVSNENIQDADISVPIKSDRLDNPDLAVQYYCAALEACCLYLEEQNNLDIKYGLKNIDLPENIKKWVDANLLGVSDVCSVFLEGGPCRDYIGSELLSRILPRWP